LRTSRRGSDLPFRWFDGQRREHPGPLRCSARSRLESSCSTATAITKVPPKKRGAAAVANPRLVGRCQSHFGFNERDPTRQLAASQRAGGGREGASSTSLRAGASADRGGELRRLQPQGCSSPKAGPTQGHVLSIGTTEATRHITIGLPVREYHVGFLRRALAPRVLHPRQIWKVLTSRGL
jgi:hypothetical protein